jgi:hypothetical protein
VTGASHASLVENPADVADVSQAISEVVTAVRTTDSRHQLLQNNEQKGSQ